MTIANLVAFSLSTLFILFATFCAKTNAATHTPATKMKQTAPSPISFSVDLTYSSNFKEDNSSEKTRDMTVEALLSRPISKHTKATVLIGASQSLVSDTKSSLLNTQVSLKRNPIKLFENTFVSGGLFVVLPTNEDNREIDTLRGGTGASIDLNQKTSVINKKLELTYTLNTLKFYHEYSRTSERTANLSLRVRHMLSGSLSLSERMSFFTRGYYQTAWTYDDVLKTKFYLQEGLSYTVTKNSNVSLSHANDGNALKSNGLSSNVSIYDPHNSYIELGWNMTY